MGQDEFLNKFLGALIEFLENKGVIKLENGILTEEDQKFLEFQENDTLKDYLKKIAKRVDEKLKSAT